MEPQIRSRQSCPIAIFVDPSSSANETQVLKPLSISALSGRYSRDHGLPTKVIVFLIACLSNVFFSPIVDSTFAQNGSQAAPAHWLCGSRTNGFGPGKGVHGLGAGSSKSGEFAFLSDTCILQAMVEGTPKMRILTSFRSSQALPVTPTSCFGVSLAQRRLMTTLKLSWNVISSFWPSSPMCSQRQEEWIKFLNGLGICTDINT